MEEKHMARYGERAQSFHALSELTTNPESPHVHQPGNPPFWIFAAAAAAKSLQSCSTPCDPIWISTEALLHKNSSTSASSVLLVGAKAWITVISNGLPWK